MNISKIDKQVLKMLNVRKIVRKVKVGHNEHKYMQDACSKFCTITGQPLSVIQNITKDATLDQFTFLKTLVNKFNYEKLNSMEDRSEHLLNVYSMVDKPSALHLNIVRKTKDSFESLEKIFSLAKDQEALQFVENLQYGELKNSNNASKIIIDLLSSKNKDRYIANTDRYSSYIELHANEEDAIKNLDNLIETGKYSKFRSDAQLAVKKLFKKQRIETAMEGKSKELEAMYTQDRASFLSSLIKNFIPAAKAPEENTKAVVVNMYGTVDSSNAKLRQSIIDRFKYTPVKDKAAEIIEMQSLFNKIDKDTEAKAFVQKAINRDLKIGSISELNEVLDTLPLKKANIFFNNAKRIIELTGKEERKTALVTELENPFFQPKEPQKAKHVRMYSSYAREEGLFSKAIRYVENRINQYRYSRIAA